MTTVLKFNSFYRNPETSHRPAFRDIIIALLENEDSILEIPSDALSSHRQAGVLGAPLEAGEAMYRELQGMYMTSASTETTKF